ncbi:asparagine synthase (glutamine-hydrolyzing) [Buttiauxella sp. A2-C2_NF]|uniref:asparagine synthase (glutamine-hydrolyzing) n=1 Tax=Buttiauxella ferragutiae TaxID=82989 RepID=UPI001E5C4A12|nr:asparagine synthase (glutamine-hydrolyzing) [Buttiauxella ferragutiae]MCE0828845.1 asparagine synthase (glutamine-hydrolyzing) [Buttiauxella ferragutiae]
MCGIAGWCAFDRDLRAQSAVIDSMTDSLVSRGPDDRGVWSDRHIALGHRRLSILDLEHGQQPMFFYEAGRPVLTMVFCGEIYNFQSLRSMLEKEGYSFGTRSDSEVLLAMYHRYQDAMFPLLQGMFAVAFWDIRRNELTLGRDRLGIKPVNYVLKEQGIIFGSEPKALLRNPHCERVTGPDELCEILDMVKTPGKTAYREMKELRPGEILKFNRHGARTSKYWSLRTTSHTDNQEQTREQVTTLLEESVRSHLISDVPVSALLSGGLDSSIIAVCASQHLPRKLLTFSMDFTRNLSEFRADAIRSSPDELYARELASFAGTAHESVLLNTDEMAAASIRARVLEAVDSPPAYWGDMWPSMYLLFRRIKERSSVALSGEGADELFGGYRWFHNPAAIAAETFPWLTPGSSRYFGGTGLFDEEFINSLRMEEYRRARYEEAVSEVISLPGESGEEKTMRRISYLNITRFLQTLLDRNDRMSMATGVEVRVPFCDHRLVEYVYNIPWRMKNTRPQEKGLLRDATRQWLPAAINERVKTPYPATQDGAYEDMLRNEIRLILDDRNSPVYPYLNTDRMMKNSQRKTSELSLPYNRGSMEMVISMNNWLRHYDISIAM